VESRTTTKPIEGKTDIAKRCLSLIGEIARRGARSSNPEVIGYALQELTQVLFERSGSQERIFEPVAPDRISDLEELFVELASVNDAATSMARSAEWENRKT